MYISRRFDYKFESSSVKSMYREIKSWYLSQSITNFIIDWVDYETLTKSLTYLSLSIYAIRYGLRQILTFYFSVHTFHWRGLEFVVETSGNIHFLFYYIAFLIIQISNASAFFISFGFIHGAKYFSTLF